MKAIEITKMSGAGNDFVVVPLDTLDRLGEGAADWVRRLCRRGLSVGADGVLFVGPVGPDRVRVVFRNPDGSAAFCANGTRCAARYARRRGMAGSEMILETAAGPVAALVGDLDVTIDLPAPIDLGLRTVELDTEDVTGRFVSAGVPHFVVWDRGFPRETLSRLGPPLRRAQCFGPDGCNVNLVRRVAPDEFHIRTWERGVEDETLSCGSGAVAGAFAGRVEGGPSRIRVIPRSGVPLAIEFAGSSAIPERVSLTGDARTVFEGRIDDETVTGFPPDPDRR